MLVLPAPMRFGHLLLCDRHVQGRRRENIKFWQAILAGLVLGSVLTSCTETRKAEPLKEAPAPPATATQPATPTAPAGEEEEVVVIETRSGNIVLGFYEKDAPRTVAEFKRLANKDFYRQTTFHRVAAGRLIQGGDPLSRDQNPYNDGTGNSGVFLRPEFNRHPFQRGTVGMARGPSPDSGSCQFFICLARNPSWDGEYTAFAEVVEGLDVAQKISEAQVNPRAEVVQLRERPIREQVINTIRIERRKKRG